MFKAHSFIQNDSQETKVLSRVVNLGDKLDLFITGSCYDDSFLDYVVNKILDYSLEGIGIKNSYKDFSGVLEHVNSVLKTWDKDTEKKGKKMHLIIAILHDETLLFSSIGKASVYLVKKNNVVEATDRRNEKDTFTFISNGELVKKDMIVFSNKRLLNVFSESDFIDSYCKNSKDFNTGLSQILQEEGMKKNIVISSFFYVGEPKDDSKSVNKIKHFAYTIGDKMFIKRCIALWLIFKEKFYKKEKMLKGVIFMVGIIAVIVLLYVIVAKTLTVSTDSENTKQYKEELSQAKIYLKKANQGIGNPDIFQLNIKKTQEIIEKLEKKNVFLEDITQMKGHIAEMSKDFNQIESIGKENLEKITDFVSANSISLVDLQNKMYIIGKKTVTGPLLKGKIPETYKFQNLGDDQFIDAAPTINGITLITKQGKIVVFGKNNNFKITDVVGQATWEKSQTISSYYSNIYLVSSDEGQIYKHKKIGKSFAKGVPYLKNEDKKDMKGLLDIAIDGGIYMLRKDLSIIKFFSNPYRLEILNVKGLPDNYDTKNSNGIIKIKAGAKLNHVYILLKNKIFVFLPNSKRVNDTKSLQYIGQIEGKQSKIIDFYVQFNGEILILNRKGLHKIKYEVNDGKLLLK